MQKYFGNDLSPVISPLFPHFFPHFPHINVGCFDDPSSCNTEITFFNIDMGVGGGGRPVHVSLKNMHFPKIFAHDSSSTYPRVCGPGVLILQKIFMQWKKFRLALNQKRGEMSYEERCKKLGWPVLSIRRDYLSLIECYKIVFGISDNLNFSDLFEMSKSQRTRANHRYKLYTKRAKANAYKYSFFVRIVSL